MRTKRQETKTMSVVVPVDLYKRLEEDAKDKGYMTSQFVRLILAKHYEEK